MRLPPMSTCSIGCVRCIRSGRGWMRNLFTWRRGPEWPSCCSPAAPPRSIITMSFPGQAGLIDAEIRAARKIGIRFHAARGSMSVGESNGGLPPDSVCNAKNAFSPIASVSSGSITISRPARWCVWRWRRAHRFRRLRGCLQETADLTCRTEVRLHTHLAETRDENEYCLYHFRKRPLDLLERRRLDRSAHVAGSWNLFQSQRNRASRPSRRGDRTLPYIEYAVGLRLCAGGKPAPYRLPGRSRRGLAALPMTALSFQ